MLCYSYEIFHPIDLCLCSAVVSRFKSCVIKGLFASEHLYERLEQRPQSRSDKTDRRPSEGSALFLQSYSEPINKYRSDRKFEANGLVAAWCSCTPRDCANGRHLPNPDVDQPLYPFEHGFSPSGCCQVRIRIFTHLHSCAWTPECGASIRVHLQGALARPSLLSGTNGQPVRFVYRHGFGPPCK